MNAERIGRRARSIATTMTRAVVATLTLATIVVATAATPAAAAGPFVVNSTGDSGDQNPGDGVCRTSAGSCSLRAAIEEANASPGPDTINFSIPGSGSHVIDINETLVINDRSGGTTINGYSEGGASENTASEAFNADVRIEITTSAAANPMLLITSAENTVRGVAIYGNGPRIELRGEDADGNKLLGNIIGTNRDYTYTSSLTGTGINRSLNVGVSLNLGPDRNVIGTSDLADRNVISGNGLYGMRINHGETSQNIVENNIIGMRGDLQDETAQSLGIDLQWYTWRNYIVGNLISGHGGQAVDLSHSTVNNVVINNRLGTLGDGNTATDASINRWGITFKDNATGNWVVDNVMAAEQGGFWHKHNYTGANNVINNRIGVGVDGGDISTDGVGMEITGHDDLYLGNIWANRGGGIFVSNYLGNGANYPAQQTLGNAFLENTFYRSPAPYIDIEPDGQNSNDNGDRDDGTHRLLNHPEITGLGPGEAYGRACGGCTVEVYVSGWLRPNGTLKPSSASFGTGAAWIGRVTADGNGSWSLASTSIRNGKSFYALAIDAENNTSEFSPRLQVTNSFQGSGSNPGQSLGRTSVPAHPDRPPAYVPDVFTCSWSNGVLSWENEGANRYYVRLVDANGNETYFDGFNGTSATVPDADGYRVVNWSQGYARSAVCGGPGVGGAGDFTCSYSNGTLSWTDQGVSTYYIRLVNGAGVDSYYSSSTGLSLNAPASAGYQVIHWSGGRNIATC